MSPPLYSDLGKSARDLFNRGYNFDTFKLDVKTKTPAGVEFTTGGVSHFDSSKVIGNLETKYKFKEYGSFNVLLLFDCVGNAYSMFLNRLSGLTFSEKWNTSNILATEVALQDLFKGTKFSAESTFAPQTGSVFVECCFVINSSFLNRLFSLQ